MMTMKVSILFYKGGKEWTQDIENLVLADDIYQTITKHFLPVTVHILQSNPGPRRTDFVQDGIEHVQQGVFWQNSYYLPLWTL